MQITQLIPNSSSPIAIATKTSKYYIHKILHIIQIGPTPPPMLPSLDQNEIEQTLYQRRVSDANTLNGIEAITDSLQPYVI